MLAPPKKIHIPNSGEPSPVAQLWPLKFKVVAQYKRARASEMTLPHYTANTPIFMPVGTKGTIKGQFIRDVEKIGYPVILANTFHLWHSPGPDVLKAFEGIHNYEHWSRGMLTDSGGFQIVSLQGEIVEEGVWFNSPLDNKRKLLTPEESIQIQNSIGADIAVCLDDVTPPTSDKKRIKEAMNRTIRWVDRCIQAHNRKDDQNLFGIVQGGLDTNLRIKCCKALMERSLPGYCIGGLSGGEDKSLFSKTVSTCTKTLPVDKPRYLMGVGYPVDLVTMTCIGVDMFDCVYPTRTARFGTAFVPSGTINLTRSEYKTDSSPIDPHCTCETCKSYSKAFVSHAFKEGPIGGQLVTRHNLHYLFELMSGLRQSIIDKSLDKFVQKFLDNMYLGEKIPQWILDTLKDGDIEFDNSQHLISTKNAQTSSLTSKKSGSIKKTPKTQTFKTPNPQLSTKRQI